MSGNDLVYEIALLTLKWARKRLCCNYTIAVSSAGYLGTLI